VIQATTTKQMSTWSPFYAPFCRT